MFSMLTRSCVCIILLFQPGFEALKTAADNPHPGSKEDDDLIKLLNDVDAQGDSGGGGGGLKSLAGGGGGGAEIKAKVLDQQKIKAISPVKSMSEVQDISKIEEIMEIDDDLALKLKAELGAGGQQPQSSQDQSAAAGSSYSASSSSSSGGGASSLKTLSEADLRAKVKKLLDLFGIEDLDDIIKVTPIKSMRKIESIEPYPEDGAAKKIETSGDEYSSSHSSSSKGGGLGDLGLSKEDLFSEELLGGGGGDHDSRRSDRYSSHRGGGGHRRRPSHRPRDDSYLDELSFSEEGFNDDLLDRRPPRLSSDMIEENSRRREKKEKQRKLNGMLRQLSDKIRRYEDELERIKADLRWEQRRESVLARMLDLAKDKVRNILKVKDKHKQKVADLLDAVERLEAKIAVARTKKANLKSELGDEDRESGGGGYDELRETKRSSGGYGGGDGGGSYKSHSKSSGGGGDHSLLDSQITSEDQIDAVTKLDAVEPLIKIKSMSKIKNIIDLTDEQAAKLKKWQQERNAAKGAKS